MRAIARIVFMGTPDFAVPSLKMLITGGYEVAAVVTQPDRPKGRGGKLVEPPVKTVAAAEGIRVFQPERPGLIRAELAELCADVFVTVAYGGILKKRVLALPRLGTVNVHASLLPKYRGPSPIHAALQNGDPVTGVTTMLTDAGIDTGDILLSREIPVADGEYFSELHDRLAELGAEVLKATLPPLLAGTLIPMPQDHSLATRAPMIEKTAGTLDFNAGARELANTVRAFGEWPGAYAELCGRRVRVHRAHVAGEGPAVARQLGTLLQPAAAPTPGEVIHLGPDALGVMCGDGRALYITLLQFENGRRMDIRECWHNLRNLLKRE